MKRAALCALVIACNLPEVQQEGAHVRFAADPGEPVCGDVVAHMDRFIELLAADFGRAPPTGDDRITYSLMHTLGFDARTVCVYEQGGCAFGGDVFMTHAPADHELVHALSWADGVSSPFFIEGLAVAYEYQETERFTWRYLFPDRHGPLTVPAAVAARESAWLPGAQYALAGAFTAFLIDRVGVEAYFRVYRRLQVADTPGLVSRVLEQELGRSLAALAAEFDATRRDCPVAAFQRKLVECSAPEIAWDGVVWTGYQTLDCEQPEVVGPFDDGTLVIDRTIVVPEDAVYRLTVIGDGAPAEGRSENRIDLVRCGGCEDFLMLGGSAGERPFLGFLRAGTYSLRFYGPADEVTGIGVRLERQRLVSADEAAGP